MKPFPILFVSENDSFIKRGTRLAEKIKIEHSSVRHVDELNIEDSLVYSCVIVDCTKLPLNEIAGSAQVASQLFTKSKIIQIVNSKLKPEELRFIYKSGANLLITENDYMNHNKIDFYLNYVLNNEWIAVKPYDFPINTEPDFQVFHYIPYNKRFISIIHDIIDENKILKMSEVTELYIKREDLPKYNSYIAKQNFNSSDGLLRRCRSKYLEFYDNYVELIYQLSDDSKHYTYQEGKRILDKSLQLSSDLIGMLANIEDPWKIVNNLSFSLDGTMTRTPAVAANVGVLGLKLDIGNIEEVMFATLVSDLSLFKLSDDGMVKFQKNSLNESDRDLYENHPKYSINMMLERRLPIEESTKQIIMYSHGLDLSTSVKNKLFKEKMPIGSELIVFSELLDKNLVLRESDNRKDISEVKKQVFDFCVSNNIISLSTLKKIQLATGTKDIDFTNQKGKNISFGFIT